MVKKLRENWVVITLIVTTLCNIGFWTFSKAANSASREYVDTELMKTEKTCKEYTDSKLEPINVNISNIKQSQEELKNDFKEFAKEQKESLKESRKEQKEYFELLIKQ
jgi:predicted component of type VI protein secretion system